MLLKLIKITYNNVHHSYLQQEKNEFRKFSLKHVNFKDKNFFLNIRYKSNKTLILNINVCFFSKQHFNIKE